MIGLMENYNSLMNIFSAASERVPSKMPRCVTITAVNLASSFRARLMVRNDFSSFLSIH